MMLIEEAIYDYTEAYDDYCKQLIKVNKFYQNDCDVFKAQLSEYFQVPVEDIDLYRVHITIHNVDFDTEKIEKIERISNRYHYEVDGEDSRSISFKIGGDKYDAKML